MSDFVHILEDYKAGSNELDRSKCEDEISVLKEEKKAVEDRIASMEIQETELTKINSTFLK